MAIDFKKITLGSFLIVSGLFAELIMRCSIIITLGTIDPDINTMDVMISNYGLRFYDFLSIGLIICGLAIIVISIFSALTSTSKK